MSTDIKGFDHGYKRVGELGNIRRRCRRRVASGKDGGATGTACPKKGRSESKPEGVN
jgi:hypothetical protein